MTWRMPLFERHPALARFSVAGLLQGATPVEPLRDVPDVYIKRDDLTATDYGGNKVRKLDFILAHARERGCKTVVAFGYAGSNFVAATAWHGRKLGLRTIGGLLPQVAAEYIVDNLSVSIASGAELFARDSQAALVAEAALRATRASLRDRALPLLIPPGGSSALGALGFVNAAVELRAQVDAGALPIPRSIVMPFSSMGSVAGLAAGLHLAGMQTRIVAVQVVGENFASRQKLRGLLDRVARLLRRAGVAIAGADTLLERVDIRTGFYGGEYGRANEAVKSAMRRFGAAIDTRCDGAYTGKALACLYADADAARLPSPALYWHTLSRSTLPAGVLRASCEEAPASLRRYWTQ